MKILKSISRAVAVAVIALVLLSSAVLAYSYQSNLQVQETSGNSYTYLPIIADVDNDYLADNGYIGITGLDTRVLSGSTELKHLVADDKVLFVTPTVGAYSTGNYKYTLGNDNLDSFPVVVGYGGYITVSDDGDLEPDDDFAFEFDGYVDTSSGDDKNLVYKEDAFQVYIYEAEAIGAGFPETYYPDAHVETSSVDGYVVFWDANGQSWATAVADAGDGAIDNDASKSADGLPVGWQCDGVSDEYDSLSRAIFLFDTSGLPDGVNIIEATLYIKGSSSHNDGGWDDTAINIYSSDPASDTALVAGDYDSLGSTAFCDTPIGINSWNTSGYNAFQLNASGLAAINTTGVTKFGARTNYDVSNTDPGWTVAGHELDFGCYFADSTGNEPKLFIIYGASASGVSSGEHTVKAYADETNLGIIVDEGEAGETSDTTALNGASVPNNDNDWIINQNNVLPYFDYYKHTVSDTLIAWYQPVSYIVSTTLDDREGTDPGETGTGEEDGAITWGSNPEGVAASVGSLISSSQPEISPASEEEGVDIVPEGGIPAGGTVDTVKLRNNPLYPFVEFFCDYSGFTEDQIWFFGATIVIFIGMAIAAVKVKNHLLLAGSIGLVLSGFCWNMGIYQWYMLLIFGFLWFMSLLSERKPVV